MKLEIEYQYNGLYICETWEYYNNQEHQRRWKANTLEDVIMLVRRVFNDEDYEPGLKELTNE